MEAEKPRSDIVARLRVVTWAMMLLDTVALAAALILALYLGFDFDLPSPLNVYLGVHGRSLAVALPVYLGLFWWMRLYRYAWRFASLEMVWGIVAANTLGLVAFVTLQFFLNSAAHMFPRSALVVFWLLGILFVGGMRILLRLGHLQWNYGKRALRMLRKDVTPRRVVIMGAGTEGARLVQVLREELVGAYDVVGFLDDNSETHGQFVRGVPVLGGFRELYRMLDLRKVDEVLIRLTGDSPEDMREYVMACRRRHVPVKVIPGLMEALNGGGASRLEDVSVEDLLRRAPVKRDLAQIGRYLTGRRVLVTGAGGSIGAEMCRQIVAMDPERLVLFGHGENSIHLIHSELARLAPELARRVFVVIGSISDDVRVDQAFLEHRPQVVFHAAAHKHVPIMELNVPEAVQNNVMGTRCVAEACGRYGVERMVLISTDKAVSPSSVMGATKWLCEEVVRMMAGAYPRTTYVTVRFGNVLGSRGSVTTIFREQIRNGGPVTVTHEEMTRYFMTIPEAVQLVLQAGAVGRSSDLYLLDMGRPVRILDLARDMIRLSGLEPDVDVAIRITGLRPGEKLHEQLASDLEMLESATNEGLFHVRRQEYFAPGVLRDVLRRLQQLASEGDEERVLGYLDEVVPSFASQRIMSEAMAESITEEVVPSL